MAKKKSKLVIDTDCGVDDAMAIMLALSDKEVCQVVGITCCFGNCAIDDVCKNVMRVLTLCGETKIPIYRGSSTAIIRHGRVAALHGSDGLGNRGHEFSTGDLRESETPAALALIEMAKEHPKEITLMAIGPLTNLAMAHRIDPHFTENLKSIVILGGNYKGEGNATNSAEFNFYCDPVSANIVLTEPACKVVLVPWETVMVHSMELNFREKLVSKKTNKARFVEAISDFQYQSNKKKGRTKFFDCDLLAVAAVIYPECVKDSFQRACVVEAFGQHTTGLTVLQLKDEDSASKEKDASNKKKIDIITSFDDSMLTKFRYQIVE